VHTRARERARAYTHTYIWEMITCAIRTHVNKFGNFVYEIVPIYSSKNLPLMFSNKYLSFMES